MLTTTKLFSKVSAAFSFLKTTKLTYRKRKCRPRLHKYFYRKAGAAYRQEYLTMAPKPWTKNQKLALWGIIVTAICGILGVINKITIEIKILQREIRHLKIEVAEIHELKADIGKFGEVISTDDSRW